jgi:hypothetical protein
VTRAFACAAFALIAIVACKAHVIELGVPDAAIDADLSSCACRLHCTTASSTVECFQLGPGSTCGSDHFCIGSFGACSSIAPTVACNGSATAVDTVCTANEASTVLCGQ